MAPRKRIHRSSSPTPSLSDTDVNQDYESDSGENNEENSCLRILFATDNHLGFMEKDPIRGEDSFNTFEEILKLAQEHNVDMLLLGGDLFHDNHPSRKTLYKTMELFRTYCLGDRPCAIEILSDQSVNFPNRFATANYQDANFNVSLPVFAIHGNHDDPSGDGHYSALDLLSIAGLVNYFGHNSDLHQVTVSPLLLRKGKTYVSVFGLGYIRDERLYRLFENKDIQYLHPVSLHSWFRLGLVHQTRVPHGPTNHLPESFLNHLDLVLWGHEHDCQKSPRYNPQQKFHVLQPGSSVATSICEGESVPKHVVLLEIQGTSFISTPLPLKTVRPMVIQDLVLQKEASVKLGDVTQAQQCILKKIESILRSLPTTPLPLLRLKVNTTGFPSTICHPSFFTNTFQDRVANPKDLVTFYQKHTKPSIWRSSMSMKEQEDFSFLGTSIDIEPTHNSANEVTMEKLVFQILKQQELKILPESEFNESVRLFVDKFDSDAVKKFLSDTLKKTCSYLTSTELLSEEQFFKSVAHQKQLLNQSFHSLLPSTHSVSSKQEKGPSTHLNTETFSDDLFNEDEEEEIEENKKEKGRELNGLSFKSSTSYAYSNEMDLDFDMPEEVS
ncbi:Double-strand break repair protein mre11a, partial [Coelomomyces lativittatus]